MVEETRATEAWWQQRTVEDLERGLVAARQRDPEIPGEVEAILTKLAELGHERHSASTRPRRAARRETR